MTAVLPNILSSVLPVLLFLVSGYGLGKVVPKPRVTALVKWITPVVWSILFVIGLKSGEAFSSLAAGWEILKYAALYAFSISAIVFALILPLNRQSAAEKVAFSSWSTLLQPLKACLSALGLVLLGAFFYRLQWHNNPVGDVVFNMTYWLYILLLLIGMDLAQVTISRVWLAPRVLLLPFLVMLGSMFAGVLISLLTGEKMAIALALSTGFGWFSLSGALAGQYLGDAYASVALLTDLMRELIGLTVVFLLGGQYAKSSIGVCGATAMDTTLPFIRQACHYQYVPTAIISGLILTVSAPFFMLFFLNLATV